MNTLIKNGTVIQNGETKKINIFVEDGMVVSTQHHLTLDLRLPYHPLLK